MDDNLHHLTEQLRTGLHDHLGGSTSIEGQRLLQETIRFREDVEMGKDYQHLHDSAKRLEMMTHDAVHRGVISGSFADNAHDMATQLRNHVERLK